MLTQSFMEQYGGMTRRVASEPESSESLEAIGKRLRALRKALDLTQAKMGRAIGSSTGGQMWGNYEKGIRRISLDQALSLCRRYGVTLDWIYRGLWHIGLPFDLAERIRYEEMKAADSAHKRK